MKRAHPIQSIAARLLPAISSLLMKPLFQVECRRDRMYVGLRLLYVPLQELEVTCAGLLITDKQVSSCEARSRWVRGMYSNYA